MADSYLRQLLKEKAPIVYNDVVAREAARNHTPVQAPVKIEKKLTEQEKFDAEAADFEKWMKQEELKRNSDTSSASLNKPGGGTDYS